MDERADYVPALPYATNRLRTATPFNVPLPDCDFSTGKPVMILSNLARGGGISKEFGNVTFIRTLLDTEKLQVPHQTMEWRYEQRRSAQDITPFLFLGPKIAAQNTDWIRQNGITMMVSVRDIHAPKLLARLLDPAILPSSIGIQTLTLDLNPSFDLMSKL